MTITSEESMEEPRHKLTRQTMGVIFLLVMALIVLTLYFYYFRPSAQPIDTGDNSTSSEVDNIIPADVPTVITNPAAPVPAPTKPETTADTTNDSVANFDTSASDAPDSSTYNQVQGSNFDER